MTHETTLGVLASLSGELAGIVERVGPSVVRIDDGSRLNATGIFWSADGVVVTTSHGVERDEDLSIVRADGTALPATLIGRDSDTDLAVLRVEATDLPAVQLAPSEEVKAGNIVLALGRPGTSGLQATLGIINARIESERAGQSEYILYTDAVLYPGFSGGPLVDVHGRVVGLANLMYGRGRGVALGIPVIASVVDTLLTHGQVPHGYLGVRCQLVALPTAVVNALERKQERALLVVQVETGSPAEESGLLLGDSLLGINGNPLEEVEELRHYLKAKQTVTLQVLRGGELREFSVTLGVAA